MNTETGHLVSPTLAGAMDPEELEAYTRVPRRLRGEARTLLGGAAERYVDLVELQDTPLARWARRDQAERRRQQKASKRARARARRIAKQRRRGR